VRHGLQRVVQIDLRQRGAQLAKLHAHPLAIEDDERRAELTDQPPDLRRLKRINESGTTRHNSYGNTAIVPLSSFSLTLAAARSSRSRMAVQPSPSGTSCTRIR
jgi:hypothetical protein